MPNFTDGVYRLKMSGKKQPEEQMPVLFPGVKKYLQISQIMPAVQHLFPEYSEKE